MEDTIYLVDLRGLEKRIPEDGTYDYLEEAQKRELGSLSDKRLVPGFLARKLALKTLLSEILRPGETKLEFARGPHGKPCLKKGPPVYFNVSYSKNYLALMVSSKNEVGIDLEIHWYREDSPFTSLYKKRQDLLHYFFTEKEVDYLNRFSRELMIDPKDLSRESYCLWDREFIRLWTRKEALIKAWGESIGSRCHEADVLSDSVNWNKLDWGCKSNDLFGKIPFPKESGTFYGWLSYSSPGTLKDFPVLRYRET